MEKQRHESRGLRGWIAKKRPVSWYCSYEDGKESESQWLHHHYLCVFCWTKIRVKSQLWKRLLGREHILVILLSLCPCTVPRTQQMFACLINKLSRKVRKWVYLVTGLHANPPYIKSRLCKHSGPKHPSVQNILDSWRYLFQWYIVGSRGSPERNVQGVDEVLSECVLITRAEPC